MLAQASAYAGALLGGMYGGYGLVLLRDWSHAPRREAAIAAGLAALGGLVMLVAGVVAEWWCRIGRRRGRRAATRAARLGWHTSDMTWFTPEAVAWTAASRRLIPARLIVIGVVFVPPLCRRGARGTGVSGLWWVTWRASR